MKEDVKYLTDNLALVGGGQLIVDIGEVLNLGELKTKPVSPQIKEQSQSEVAIWGEENNFPQQVIEIAELSTELPALLDWKARLLIGRGVVAMQKVFNADKKKWEYEAVQDDEIDLFLTDTTTKRYFYEAATDLYWFANIFPELIKSKDGKSIAYIGTQDASFCRWSKMNKKGVVENCYINANWPDAKVSDEETTTVDVIDPYDFERVENTRNSKKERYIYPVSTPSPGKIYYQLAPWNGFITSSWAEISRAVPKSKNALMKQILSAKFILQIPFSYWPMAYKDWTKLTEEQQMAKKKAKVKEINEQLTGIEATGRTILVEVGMDPLTGKEIPGWKIIPIESGIKGGESLEDSREASQHLRQSLDLDPTLVGEGPGKSIGAGSGSDKRVAFNMKVSMLGPHRELLLEPLYFIADYNGWRKKYPRLEFKFIEVELETLDKGKTSSEVLN